MGEIDDKLKLGTGVDDSILDGGGIDNLNSSSSIDSDIIAESVKCAEEAFTKKSAIRAKDRLQSSSSSQWYYYNCDICEKWHIATTGEKRSGFKKKAQR